MIYYDPSESRASSRLSRSIQERGRPLPRLEEQTGADLLVTPLHKPAGSERLLRQHCEAGVLVQRKSGQDFPSSVTDGRLSHSLHKMLQWTDRPWLVVCAHVVGRSDGTATVDGRESLSFNALVGALDWWQLRGGYYTVLSTDEHLEAWLDQWPQRLKRLAQGPHVVRTAQQELMTGLGQVDTLCTFPGIGQERAEALLDGRTLAEALSLLSNPEGGPLPKGLGDKTRMAAYRWLGLDGYNVLRVECPAPWDRILSALLDLPPEEVETETWPLLYAATAQHLRLDCISHDSWEDWLKDEIKWRRKNSSDSI